MVTTALSNHLPVNVPRASAFQPWKNNHVRHTETQPKFDQYTVVDQRRPYHANDGNLYNSPERICHISHLLSREKQQQVGNCCVCLSSKPQDGNNLIFCESSDCDVCVHQECYGVQNVSSVEQTWFCQRCCASDKASVRCVLCPQRGGAFKKLVDEEGWIHISCALWFPEVEISDEMHMDGIKLGNIAKDRFNQVCRLCPDPSDASWGACVRCDYPECFQMFHVTCAQRLNLLEEVVDHPDKECFFVYCMEHASHKLPEMNAWASWVKRRTDYETSLKAKGKCKLYNSTLVPQPGLFRRDLIPARPMNSLEMLVEATKHMQDDISSPSSSLLSSPSPRSLNSSSSSRSSTPSEKFRHRYQSHPSLQILTAHSEVDIAPTPDLVTDHEHIQKHHTDAVSIHKVKSTDIPEQAGQHLERANGVEEEDERRELELALLSLTRQRPVLHILRSLTKNPNLQARDIHQDNVIKLILNVNRNAPATPTSSTSNRRLRVRNVSQDFNARRRMYLNDCTDDVTGTDGTRGVCGSVCEVEGITKETNPDCHGTIRYGGVRKNYPTKQGNSHGLRSNSRRSLMANTPSHQSPLLPTGSILELEETDTDKCERNDDGDDHSDPIEDSDEDYTPSTDRDDDDDMVLDKIKLPTTSSCSPSSSSAGLDSGIKAVQQSPRFEGDLYTPKWIRGVGKSKEGLCPHCPSDPPNWLKIKISAYWYHLNYQHGVSAITGRRFDPPTEERVNQRTRMKEALCHKCGEWILNQSPRDKEVLVPEIYWWKHAQKCHHTVS